MRNICNERFNFCFSSAVFRAEISDDERYFHSFDSRYESIVSLYSFSINVPFIASSSIASILFICFFRCKRQYTAYAINAAPIIIRQGSNKSISIVYFVSSYIVLHPHISDTVNSPDILFSVKLITKPFYRY